MALAEFDIEKALNRIEHHDLTLDGMAAEMSEVYRNGHPPVPIEEFLDDDFYMGKVAKDLYPDNRPDMLELFHPSNNYIEVILTGATSIGKTFMAALGMTYIIYTMGCYSYPHRWLGGSAASPVVIINMSVNAQKAREVIFTRVKTMIDMSPYFKEYFPRDLRLVDSLVWRTSLDPSDTKNRTGAQIMFKPGTGDSLSALGDDIYAGIGDELNFFRVIEKSKRSYGEAFDPAQRLYDVISRRMKGRFSAGGLALGKFFLLSSAQYPDDFIERRIAEAEADGSLGKTVKVIRKTIWEAKRGVSLGGVPVFSAKTFRVEVGTTRRGSRLLDHYDREKKATIDRGFTDIEGKVLRVPVELYDDFYRDIEGSVRDFGGEVTRAIAPFFADTDVIYAAANEELEHPWTIEQTTLEDGSSLDIERLFVMNKEEQRWRCRRHPNKLRFAHVDLAKSQDSAGVGIAHIAGWKRVMKAGREYDEPIYETDLVLRINPPRGGEIRFSRIREIFYLLRNHGMTIGKITFDSFQSTDAIQELNNRGFRAGELSVDRDIAPYTYLKDCYYDGRLVMYRYEPLIVELSRLEKKGDKVDHPSNGSKDISDALAGAVWNCYLNSSRLSDSEQEARLPTVGAHQNPLFDTKAERARRAVADAEEEMRDWMGGSRKVR